MYLILSTNPNDMQKVMLKTDALKDYQGGFLFSYLAIKNKMVELIPIIEEIKKLAPRSFIMLDSGAPSFLHMYANKMTEKSVSMGHGVNNETIEICKHRGIDRFVEDYARFMHKYTKYFDCFVELDLQAMYGSEKVESWRNLFYHSIGEKLMVVWHGEDDATMDDWCKKYPFIGLGGTAVGKEKRTPKSIKYLIQRYPKNKFHLFALTGNDCLLYASMGCFSADSTSWKMGSRYGIFYHFTGGKLMAQSKYFLRMDAERVDKMNLIAWSQYGNHLASLRPEVLR